MYFNKYVVIFSGNKILKTNVFSVHVEDVKLLLKYVQYAVKIILFLFIIVYRGLVKSAQVLVILWYKHLI